VSSQSSPAEPPRAPRSLFIVGAPRCGTTFLAKSLAGHPAVCFSKPKETHFFVRAAPGLAPADVAREYLRRHFPHLGPEHRLLGEGSPSTLYDPAALERMLSFDPAARFAVALRNPIDMASSHHARMLYTLDEDEPDFARAWALQEARARGTRIPRRCREPLLLQYARVCRVAEPLARLLHRVGRARCHVVVFDDLAADPLKAHRALLEFAGLEDDGRAHLSRKNENRAFRRGWIQSYVMNPPLPIARLVEIWEHRGMRRPRWLRAARRRLKKWNTRRAERTAPPPELRKRLYRAFADDIERLEELLGRDLSHWR